MNFSFLVYVHRLRPDPVLFCMAFDNICNCESWPRIPLEIHVVHDTSHAPPINPACLLFVSATDAQPCITPILKIAPAFFVRVILVQFLSFQYWLFAEITVRHVVQI